MLNGYRMSNTRHNRNLLASCTRFLRLCCLNWRMLLLIAIVLFLSISVGIIGYICYAILLLMTIGWMLDVRYENPPYPIVLGSIYFLIFSIVVPVAGINFLHLLWLIPSVYCIMLLNTFIWSGKIPFVTKFLSVICDFYTSILRIGSRI